MTSLAVPNLNIPNMVSAHAVAASTTANSGAGASSAGSAAMLTQTQFLQLLTAQLKYQTPSTPADPTQLATEFASISTADGISQLSTQLSAIQTGSQASQLAQAAALVGKQVAVVGDVLTPGPTGAAPGAFDLAGAAQSVSVSVLAPNGAVADTLNLGALPPGQQNFTWNNGTPGNHYTYQVNAADAAGAVVPVIPYSVYTVAGVNLSGTTPTLNIQGSPSPVPVASIQTVLGAPL